MIICVCTYNPKPLFQLFLRHGDIPAMALSVTIRNSAHVIVEENAIGGLASLVNFTLSDIDQLEIRRGGMTSQNQHRLRSVRFENVKSVQVESKAFAGTWQAQTTILMHHIEELRVQSRAFLYQTDVAGPTVSLQHVNMLNIEPYGFSAPVFLVSLANVGMDACHEGSFGGNTFITEWTNVTANKIETNCFYGVNDTASLNLISFKANQIDTGAFSGNVGELIIERSFFGTIREKGFNMSVSSMEVTKSSFVDLHTTALHVLARKSLWLNLIRIDRLRKNALIGLSAGQDADGSVPMLRIRKLEIIEGEEGSLTFSECATVQLIDVDLVAPWPRICPTEKWTRTMSGGGPEGQLTQSQSQLYQQLKRRHLCPSQDRQAGLPVTVDTPRCQGNHQQAGSETAFALPEDSTVIRPGTGASIKGVSGMAWNHGSQEQRGDVDNSSQERNHYEDGPNDTEKLGNSRCRNTVCAGSVVHGSDEADDIQEAAVKATPAPEAGATIPRPREKGAVRTSPASSGRGDSPSADKSSTKRLDVVFYAIVGVSIILVGILSAALVLTCTRLLR